MHFIDLYCERHVHGFWDEPINALSNLGFVIAAVLAYHTAAKRGNILWIETILILLAGLIGIGSFLFHTLANTSAELADVIPIWSFVALYVLSAIYFNTGRNMAKTGRIAAYVLGSVGLVFYFTSGNVVSDTASAPTDPFNGSLQYLPALIAVLGFAVISTIKAHPAARLVQLAAGAFLVSLCARTFDLQMCALTHGIGTHFLWHLLNAVMVWALLMALIRYLVPMSRQHV